MKKLLLILFCVCPIVALGQTPGSPTQVNNTNYYSFQNYMGAVQGFMLPQRDTNWTPSAPALVYRPADSSLYYWKWNKWQKVGGISSSTDTSFSLYLLKTNFIDSLNNNRQIITRRNDSLFLSFGGSVSMVPDSTIFPTWIAITDSGYLKKETDPVFTSSPASTITTTNINNWQTAYNSASVGNDTLYLKSILGAVTALKLNFSTDTTQFHGTGVGYGMIKIGSGKTYGDTLAYSADTTKLAYGTSVNDSIGAHSVTINSTPTISVSGGNPQSLKNNPSFTLNANNNSPLWNAVQLQGTSIQNNAPTAGQVLYFNGSTWTPYSLNPGSGTVTAVGMTNNYGLTVQSNSTNPITAAGTFNVGVDTTKVPNLRYADSALATKLLIPDTTNQWAPRGSYVHPADTVGKWAPLGNYKMAYDSTASTGYVTHQAQIDSFTNNALTPLVPLYINATNKTLYVDTSINPTHLATINALNDTLNKINGINGWLYNTTTRTGQVDSTKYSTINNVNISIKVDTVKTIAQLETYNKLQNVNTIIVTDSLRGGLFTLQNSTGLVPDSCTIFPSSTSGNYWVRQRNDPNTYLVTWAGASPSQPAYNNRIAIQETINAASKKSNFTIVNSTVIVPQIYNNFANYLIDSTITVPPQVNFIMDGQIYYSSGVAQPAIVIGNKTSNNYRSNFKINLLAYEDNNNWAENSIGVELLNMSGCSIDIKYISGFQTGALVGSYNGYDNIYNKFDLGLVNNCQYGINIKADNTSAVTDNIFNGGNITVNSNMENSPFDTLSQYGVVLDSGYIAGNTFNNITIQLLQSFKKNNAVSIPILFISGSNNNNLFNHCWLESNNRIYLKIEPASNSSFNTVKVDNNYPFPADSTNTGVYISDSSFDGTNDVILNNRSYSISPVTTVFNSGYLLNNITKYNSSSFSIRGLSFINYSTGVISINSSGISSSNDGLEFTNPYASFLVNTSNDKNFNLYTGIDSTMRENIYIIAYDSSGIPINPFHYKTIYSMQIASMDSSAFGGIGSMYSPGIYDNSVLFKVSDSVKKIRVCISNSRPMTNIQLLSYNGETTYSYSDFDSLNNILGVSQTVPQQNYPSGTWVKNDFSNGSNAVFWYRNNGVWDSVGSYGSFKLANDSIASTGYASHYYVNSQGFLKTEVDPVWTAAKSANTDISGAWNFSNSLQIGNAIPQLYGWTSYNQRATNQGGYYSYGNNSGYIFGDRKDSSNAFFWYDSARIARLYYQPNENTSAQRVASVDSVGDLNITGNASIGGNISASIIAGNTIEANSQLSIQDTIIKTNFTISSTHTLYICDTSVAITATLSTTNPNWSGSPIIIIKNIGTGTVTLTNTWTSDPTSIAAGASEILTMVNVSGTDYWIKLN